MSWKNLYPCDYPNSVGSIQSGEIFTLKAGESITLNGLHMEQYILLKRK